MLERTVIDLQRAPIHPRGYYSMKMLKHLNAITDYKSKPTKILTNKQ